jgi:carbamoyl-phosphate synthase large subunit
VLSVPELNVSAPIEPQLSDTKHQRRLDKRLAKEKIAEPQYVGGVGRGGPFRVAVSGAGGPAGMAVIRSLLGAGHDVVALDADPIAAGFQLPGVRSSVVPRFDDETFAEALTSIVEVTGVQALICTVAEEYAPFTAIASTLSDLGCKTWIPELEAVERCLDKAAFAFAMEEYGIAHPPTATTPRASRRLPGPWIVKPRRGRGSRGFAFVDNRRTLRRIMRHDKELLAQSRLTGEEFTADVLVDRNGQVVTCVPRWRLETRGGISVKGLTFDSSEVTRLCAEVVAATGITGPVNIQGMVDPSGAVAIIELNPRFSGGLPLTLAAGADVVGAYLQAILEPERRIAPLYFDVGVLMTRYFEEIFDTSGVQ